MRKIILSFWIFFLFSGPLFAEETDQTAKIKAAVEEVLKFQTDLALHGGEGMRLSGDIRIISKDSFYEVTLPGVEVLRAWGKINIGTVIMNVIPASGVEYRLSMALPKNISVYDPAGQIIAELSLPQQSFSGVWRSDLGIFTQLDAAYGDIHFVIKNADDFTVKIGAFKTMLRLTEDADQTWSGPSMMELTGVKIGSPREEGGHISLDRLAMRAAYEGFNPKAAKDIKDRLQQVIVQGNTFSDVQAAEKFITETLQKTATLLGSTGSQVEIEGFDLHMPPISMHLSAWGWSFEVSGLKEVKGNMSFKTNMQGLRVEGIPNIPQELMVVIPQSAGGETRVENFPMKGISEMMTSFLAQTFMMGVAAQQDQLPLQAESLQKGWQEIPDMLTETGTTFSIRNMFVETPVLLMKTEGKFIADEKAVYKITGKLRTEIGGLDELIQRLSDLSKNDPSKKDLARPAQGLGIIQFLGVPEKAANGKSLRIYQIDLTPDGGILLNGKNFSLLTGLFSSQQQGQGTGPARPVFPIP